MIINCDVANGATTSSSIAVGADVGEMGLVAIVTPSALTSTTINIQASTDGTNWKSVTDRTGTLDTLTVAADRYIALDPAIYCGVPYIRLSLSAAEAAARVIQLVLTEVA